MNKEENSAESELLNPKELGTGESIEKLHCNRIDAEPPSRHFSGQLEYVRHLPGLERHESILPLLHATAEKRSNRELDYLMREFAEVSVRGQENGNINSMPRHSPKMTIKKMGPPITNEGGASTSGVGSQTASGVRSGSGVLNARPGSVTSSGLLSHMVSTFNADAARDYLEKVADSEIHGSINVIVFTDYDTVVVSVDSRMVKKRKNKKDLNRDGKPKNFECLVSDSVNKYRVLVTPSLTAYGVVSTGVGFWGRVNAIWVALEDKVKIDGVTSIDQLMAGVVDFMETYPPEDSFCSILLAGHSSESNTLVVYVIKDRRSENEAISVKKYTRDSHKYLCIGGGTYEANNTLRAELLLVDGIDNARAIDASMKAMFSAYKRKPSVGGYLCAYVVNSRLEVSPTSSSVYVPVRRTLAFELFKEMPVENAIFFCTKASYKVVNYSTLGKMIMSRFNVSPSEIMCLGILNRDWHGFMACFERGTAHHMIFLKSEDLDRTNFVRTCVMEVQDKSYSFLVARPKFELMEYLHIMGGLIGHPY